MPRRLLGIFILLLVSVPFVQAQGEAVLLKIGRETVLRKEFESCFHRSPERNIQAFLQTFIDHKLKVLYAKELGLDTLTEVRKQLDYYRQACQTVPEEIRKNESGATGGKEWIRLRHVTLPLSQHHDQSQELEARQKLDSLYRTLKNPDDWKRMARELPWRQTRHLLREWQEQLERLPQGQVSGPFRSPQGLHLISWEERKRAEKPNENRLPAIRSRVEEWPAIREALLLAALAEHHPEDVACTESDLENYFLQHRTDYGWGVPHFRGAVVHCQNKKEAKVIRKYLKKYPLELWQEALRRMPDRLVGQCRLEKGFFRIGENAYVDKLAFKCGNFEQPDGYPYTFVLGDKMKKGPESHRDVREKVASDYRKKVEKDRSEELKQKYRVEINEEVLKTVNNEGNK